MSPPIASQSPSFNSYPTSHESHQPLSGEAQVEHPNLHSFSSA